MADRRVATHVERWRVHPGRQPRLPGRDPAATDDAPGDRAATEVAAEGQIAQLSELQDRLWAEARRSMLVVLQGMDAAGKDGTIKHVFRGVNPQGVRVVSFKQPTPIEHAHDFLWRVHRQVPAAGEIGIFNRSHYEDLLVPRVHRQIGGDAWRARAGHVVGFERLLADAGTTLVKLFLHISFEEQGHRLAQRLEDPHKHWKMQPSDLVEREWWDAYQRAYEDVLAETSTDHAPWYVVPADHKWYRNWVVGEILLDALRRLDPRYPTAAPAADEAPSGR